jgi:hypothetical protein
MVGSAVITREEICEMWTGVKVYVIGCPQCQLQWQMNALVNAESV